MEFERYLRILGSLYVQGIMSNESPSSLRHLGGALALAGRDATWIRFEENGTLGLVDTARNYDDRLRIARRRWGEIRRGIERRLSRGEAPTVAMERFMGARGTTPHSPEAVSIMVQETLMAGGPNGTTVVPMWQSDLVRMRRRLQHGSSIMGDTFGNIGTQIYLIANAEDWENATPEEWDVALARGGESGRLLGQIADAAAGVRMSRQDPTRRGSSISSNPPLDSVGARAVEGQRSVQRNRGIEASEAPRNSRPTRGRSGSPDVSAETDSQVEAGLSEGAPLEGSRPLVRERPRHRRGVRAGSQFASLDAITNGMTAAQRRSVRRIANRFPSSFQRVWNRVNNSLSRRRTQEIRKLWRQGKYREARRMARDNYNNYRGRFWSAVRGNSRLVQMLSDAGLVFGSGATTAPYWRLPDGTVERLSLEHTFRVTDEPWRSTDGGHMRLVPARENSNTLEFIRENDPFQNAGP